MDFRIIGTDLFFFLMMSSRLRTPSPLVITCHHWFDPPSPLRDDVIYGRPLCHNMSHLLPTSPRRYVISERPLLVGPTVQLFKVRENEREIKK